jgi:hypothetical protein
MQFLLTTVGMTSNEDNVPSQSGAFAVGNVTLQGFFNGLSLGGFEGSGVMIPFTVSAGDSLLTLQYDFLSNEPFQTIKRDDFAFAAVFDAANGLQIVDPFISVLSATFDPFSSQTPFQFHTGLRTLSLSVASLTPGNYTLGIGVEDRGTADHASGLLLDNVQLVPEPSVFALGVGGVCLLAAARRRIKGA